MPDVRLVCPVPTPFDDRGEPAWSLLAALLTRNAPYVDGFLLYGSTGESVHLQPDERAVGLARFRELVAEHASGTPFWVGVIEETLSAAMASTRAAIDAGAQVILATPPRYYDGGARRAVACDYFESLADLAGAAGRELWLYHVPQLSKVDLPLDTTEALSHHAAITGIKDSSGVAARLAFYQSRELSLTVLTGHAPTLLGGLALGARGATLAACNVAPKGYRTLIDAWHDGRIDEATRLQSLLEPLGRVVAKDSITLVKDALRALGVPAGATRRPYPSRSEHADELEALLETLGTAGLLA